MGAGKLGAGCGEGVDGEPGAAVAASSRAADSATFAQRRAWKACRERPSSISPRSNRSGRALTILVKTGLKEEEEERGEAKGENRPDREGGRETKAD